MAPQKAAVLSQSLQKDQLSAQKQPPQQTAKPRNKKPSKRQASLPNREDPVTQQEHNPSKNGNSQIAPTNGHSKTKSVNVEHLAAKNVPQVVPAERTTLKNKQLNNSINSTTVPSEDQATTLKKATPAAAIITPSSVITKQTQFDEADDVDAGIELDGSSNSGSSVKDIGEDPSKSSSASPVMAQANSEVRANYSTSSNVQELAYSEQINNAATLCPPPETPKKLSVTKRQLAENLQVIDADEQQLQTRLESKQKKSAETIDQTKTLVTSDKQQTGSIDTGDDKANRFRRKFSSQTSQDGQSGSLCKVCEQHVYQMERILAEKSVYHKQCFRCYQCKMQLRVDNYSSHEGHVYCKVHHRQLFQPQVKLEDDNDSDTVAKSTSKQVDEYLLQRGRLSELTFSFLNQTSEGNRQRQMIICENEPAQLADDVVRSNSKPDDGIDRLNVNLNNILQKFEKASGETSQPTSPSVIIERPSFNLKKTLMAFETGQATNSNLDESDGSVVPGDKPSERPTVRKLTNIDQFLNRNSSNDDDDSSAKPAVVKQPMPVNRSGSLLKKLQKFESRIAGHQVQDDEENSSEESEDGNNNKRTEEDSNDLKYLRGSAGIVASKIKSINNSRRDSRLNAVVKPTFSSINLSSLKNQWETGDIVNRNYDDNEDDVTNVTASDTVNSPNAEKNEELSFIREQLARKKVGESGSIRNIYENAVKEAQLQQQKQQASSRRESSDLSALNGFSTSGRQQQLLQKGGQDSSMVLGSNNSSSSKVHLELNSLSNKANKLKEKFELGLINNATHDDSDQSESDENPAMTKLEQIRREKLDDLSVFTEGEIKAREARSLFQQIDQRISAESTARGLPKRSSLVPNSRSLASISASMSAKLTTQINSTNGVHIENHNHDPHQHPSNNDKQQPICLTNNVKL